MADLNKLTKLLKEVPDSYDDFVVGLTKTLRHTSEETYNEMIKFMAENPRADTSDVSEKLNELYKPWEHWDFDKLCFTDRDINIFK